MGDATTTLTDAGGNEATEASGVEGHEKWLGKYAGCNVSEH